jgi:hypothetical protein
MTWHVNERRVVVRPRPLKPTLLCTDPRVTYKMSATQQVSSAGTGCSILDTAGSTCTCRARRGHLHSAPACADYAVLGVPVTGCMLTSLVGPARLQRYATSKAIAPGINMHRLTNKETAQLQAFVFRVI